jgi:hypothetical protein
MAKSKTPAVDLGLLQTEVVASARELEAAQRALIKANQAYEEKLASHEKARVNLNTAVAAVKAATNVSNLYAG